MRSQLSRLERVARHAMAVVAVLGVLAALALRFDMISKAPFYRSDAWYLESDASSYVVLGQYGSQAECRRHEKPFTTCRSGRTLREAARGGKTATRVG